ncbi:MAG: nitronate monooxygenase [Gemmatimonadetes bacterium]|nr:nitronate monooxygenase [Gemmatimonadota bacterium]
MATPLTRHLGIATPIICGPLYPCSNPELVAAVSAAGGIGVVQPISLTYVHGHEFRAGLRLIRELSGGRPYGFNALIEASSRTYLERMRRWVDVALEEGVRFFITSLGNPRWVVDAVAPHGGLVFHDVTELKWGAKGRDGGAHGLIAVNRRAGGHTGSRTPQELFDELAPLGLPVVCAGGIATGAEVAEALRIGYVGVQLGTRFIATPECRASGVYKEAILRAEEDDIVLTERITGVPVSVIRTPYITRLGTTVGPVARWLFRGRRTKHWMRTFYGLRSLWQLKRSSLDETGEKDYWQAGRSVHAIDTIEPAGEIVRRLTREARAALD